MASRVQGFFDKCRVYFRFFKKDLSRGGTLVTCSYCDSYDVGFIQGHEEKHDDRIEYTGTYKCRKCGSICNHKQTWYKGRHRQ